MNYAVHWLQHNWLAVSLLVAVLAILARDILAERRIRKLKADVARLLGAREAFIQRIRELEAERQACLATIVRAAEVEEDEQATPIRRLPPVSLPPGRVSWGAFGRDSVPRLPSFDLDATKSWSGPWAA